MRFTNLTQISSFDDHHDKLASTLGKYAENRVFTDVNIYGKDPTASKSAHKSILFSKCPEIGKLLVENPQADALMFPDFPFSTIESFASLLYQGKTLSSEQVKLGEILSVAGMTIEACMVEADPETQQAGNESQDQWRGHRSSSDVPLPFAIVTSPASTSNSTTRSAPNDTIGMQVQNRSDIDKDTFVMPALPSVILSDIAVSDIMKSNKPTASIKRRRTQSVNVSVTKRKLSHLGDRRPAEDEYIPPGPKSRRRSLLEKPTDIGIASNQPSPDAEGSSLRCLKCPKVSRNHRDLTAHLAANHFDKEISMDFTRQGNMGLECTVCGYFSKRTIYVLGHVAKEHDGLKSYLTKQEYRKLYPDSGSSDTETAPKAKGCVQCGRNNFANDEERVNHIISCQMKNIEIDEILTEDDTEDLTERVNLV